MQAPEKAKELWLRMPFQMAAQKPGQTGPEGVQEAERRQEYR
jgi:hypothetical protein